MENEPKCIGGKKKTKAYRLMEARICEQHSVNGTKRAGNSVVKVKELASSVLEVSPETLKWSRLP